MAWKNELLFQNGVNFNDTPLWQRRGTGLYVEAYERTGRDPRTGEERTATRRRVRVDAELPMGDAYAAFLRRILERPDQRAGTGAPGGSSPSGSRTKSSNSKPGPTVQPTRE